MTTQLISYYLQANLLLIVTTLAIIVAMHSLRLGVRLQSASLLKSIYALIGLSLALPLILALLPGDGYFRPTAQLWSASSMRTTAIDQSAIGLPAFSDRTVSVAANASAWSSVLAWILVVSVGLGMLWRLARYWRLCFFCLQLPVVRRVGRVRISISDTNEVPFAARIGHLAMVVIPQSYLADSQSFRIAVGHEIQHHRQGDTLWVLILELLRAMNPLNPLLTTMSKLIDELQEYACDEALVGRQRFSLPAYSRCLVAAAHKALGQPAALAGTTSMAKRSASKFLQRRLKMLLGMKDGHSSKLVTALALSLMIGTVTATALAGKNLVQDQRLTQQQANALAEKAQKDTDFPIVMNDLVLKQLNRYVGTPDGRRFMKDALVRKQDFHVMVTNLLQTHNVPQELAAIPIIESGYANLSEPQNADGCCAGLWQFRRQTARRFGLRVNDQVDERLVAAKATVAAIQLLQHDKELFSDWLLSVAAYNMGEGAVRKSIAEGGTRDPWELTRQGKLEPYLSAVMAAIIIMKNPEILN